ncbi:ATP binding domain 4 [Kappamyces sp. JEL0680]|nr:ATP binding domain 4 [Kappamyces sp. JEL0680]
MALFGALNSSYSSFFGANPSTRVTVESRIRGAVQIDVLAYLDTLSPLEHLHVQGISYWAPANIGPYSQAVRAGDLLFMAGMIGLQPLSMQLAPRDLEPQQSLKSVRNVAATMKSDLAADCLACVCYLSSTSGLSMARRVWDQQTEGETKYITPLFVVVPGLPKNASIEWQVLLFSPAGWRELESRNPDIDASLSLAPSLDIQDFVLDSDGCVGRFQHAARGTGAFLTGVLGGSSLESLLVQHLYDAVCRTGTPDSIVSIRLFYTAVLDASRLETSTARHFGNGCSVTFVPVLALDTIALADRTQPATVGVSVFFH